jgi:hypothetical protein
MEDFNRKSMLERSSYASDQMSEMLITPLDYHGIMPSKQNWRLMLTRSGSPENAF